MNAKLVLRVEWNETVRTCRDPFDTKKFSNLSPEILVEWIATSSNGLVPFHSQNKFRAHLKMKNARSLLLVLKLDEDFDSDINDIAWAALFIVI